MLDWIEKALRLFDLIPVPLWALLAGTLISWGITQYFKQIIPPNFLRKNRVRLTRIISFVAGTIATYALIGGVNGCIAGLIVGLWSPVTWQVAMFIVGKKYPDLRKSLSGDVL